MTTPDLVTPPPDDPYYPRPLREAEDALVRERRERAGVVGDPPRVGIACSGGGIRSATLCLGMFQALAKTDRLRRVDFMSTISGGGYFGGFLGNLFIHAAAPTAFGGATEGSPAPSDRVRAILSDLDSPSLEWLRKHGRYIAPNGAADYANIVGVYVRNWAAVQYVVAVFFLTLFLALIALRAVVDPHLPQEWAGILQTSTGWHWSPWVVPSMLLFGAWCVPLGVAFWLTQYGANRDGIAREGRRGLRAIGLRFWNNDPLIALLLIAAFCAVWLLRPGSVPIARILSGSVFAICVLALLAWIFAEAGASTRAHRAQAGATLAQRQLAVRNLLSDWLAGALTATLVALLVAAIDSAAESAYRVLASGGAHALFVSLWGLAVVAMPVVHRLAPILGKAFRTQGQVGLRRGAQTAGWLLLAVVVLGWDVAAYAIAFAGGDVAWGVAQRAPVLVVSITGVVLGIGINALTSATMTFINLSSLQGFYAARLRRAFLGAANPQRIAAPDSRHSADHAAALLHSVRRDVTGDDRPWRDYAPHEQGGPLHLLGVTVNHTIAAGSDLELRDRKGFTMAMGPAGASAGAVSHALWQGDRALPLPCSSGDANVFGTRAHRVESMPLSRWIAVSGAAFSTGLGTRTTIGMSLLLGLANVRLGYWWNSGNGADARARSLWRLLRAQHYLEEEFSGRFPGATQSDWYLTDGGHSENTGALELIRRRLPVVVVLDHGEDGDYRFEDFANLVRRARIDFGVRIAEWSREERERMASAELRTVCGSLAELRRTQTSALGLPVAARNVALFHVRYDDTGFEATLALVKPALVGDEPADVAYYAASHPAFPQEPTTDQFFDEMQWESYRRLGEHIGMRLFSNWDFSPPVRA